MKEKMPEPDLNKAREDARKKKEAGEDPMKPAPGTAETENPFHTFHIINPDLPGRSESGPSIERVREEAERLERQKEKRDENESSSE